MKQVSKLKFLNKTLVYIVAVVLSLCFLYFVSLSRMKHSQIENQNVKVNNLEIVTTDGQKIIKKNHNNRTYEVVMSREGNTCIPKKIQILNSDNKIEQVIDIKNPSSEECMYFHTENTLQFGDYNFDGIDDFSLFSTMTARNGAVIYFYLFNEENKKFIFSSQLSELTNIVFEKNSKIITSMNSSGNITLFQKQKFSGDLLVPVDTTTSCYLQDSTFETTISYNTDLKIPSAVSISITENKTNTEKAHLVIKDVQKFLPILNSKEYFGECNSYTRILDNGQIVRDGAIVRLVNITDNDLGQIVLFDINFDNREDLAVQVDSGNAGFLYDFYTNDSKGNFIQSNLTGLFPSEFDYKNKTIIQGGPNSSHSFFEKKLKYDEMKNEWVELTSVTKEL